MGSRAIVVICRDADVARSRFGVASGESGCIYTRTGRQFFAGADENREAVARTAKALDAAGLFRELETDWLCLDAEIMPWSAKAQSLIEQQYGPVGAAARTGARTGAVGGGSGSLTRRRPRRPRRCAR